MKCIKYTRKWHQKVIDNLFREKCSMWRVDRNVETKILDFPDPDISIVNVEDEQETGEYVSDRTSKYESYS